MTRENPRESENPEKKENILLDARIEEMISNTAFRARLKNGHTLVAYLSRSQKVIQDNSLSMGDVVQVRMSPFDMSRGEVVHQQDDRS